MLCSQTQLITLLATLGFNFDDDDVADAVCSLSELNIPVQQLTATYIIAHTYTASSLSVSK